MQTKEKNKMFYLSNDLVFKHIFGTQENAKYAIDLIESFYNLEPGTIKNIKILNSVKLIQMIIEEKKFEMDVLIELESGELINLEMYNVYDENAERKSILYITKVLSTKSIKSGEDYTKLRKATQINFANGDMVHDYKKLIKTYGLVNKTNQNDKIMEELLEINIVDIDAEEEVEYNNINERLKIWLKLLRCEDEEQLKHIASQDKLLGEVVKEMEAFSNDEWVQDYESRDRLIESQHKTEMEKAEKRVKEEIAKKMLLKNEEITYISEITDLTIEEVKKLKEKL